MKLARELEQRLERLVDGVSAAVFGGRMHPVDLADRLVRQVDFLVEDGAAGPEIPNHYTVRVNPGDLDPAVNATDLSAELTHVVDTTAMEHGWRIGGPIRVAVEGDDEVPKGLIDCEAVQVAEPLPPWARLLDVDVARVFDVADNRVLIGRALDVDIRVNKPEVSRHHAIIFRDMGGPQLYDLGSSNGTFHNGNRVAESPVALAPGDEIQVGHIVLSFRAV